MEKVLVTGSEGFIGKNLCAQLELEKDVEVIKFNRSNTLDDISGSINEIDFIFHIAGVNRPKDEAEFDQGNRELTQDILKLVQDSQKKIPILVTSSIHAELDNPYGKSKKAAEDAVFDWQKATGNKAYIYRLPNVFGKWCRPNYNSAVATFCHNISHDLEITVNDPSVNLTLVYIDTVVNDFISTFRGQRQPEADGFCHVSRTDTLTLGELVAKLKAFKESRDSLLMPSFEADIDRYLYATYTSYFDKDDFGYTLDKKVDDRGWLAEFIKSKQFGQVFVSRTKPGITRGNHWHNTKIEKFLVIDGEADIEFRLVGSDQVIKYHVTSDELKVVDIPAGYVHSITNTGKTDLTTLFWADEIFNPDAPDTNYEEVKQ